jgi:hypothetical protein
MKKEYAKRATEILESKMIIVIATAGKDGQPWNTPVAGFRFPGGITFYWTSWQDNQHSKNIRDNRRVFIVVYDEESAEGVYLLADAQELSDEKEVWAAAKVFGDNKFCTSNGDEYLGDKPRRIYKAVPKQAWMNADKTDENGKFQYDYRIELPLEELAKQLHRGESREGV